MRRFIFRAQVAIDLRRKQEDDARRQLAEATARQNEAAEALDAAQGLLDDTMRRGREEDERPGDLAARIWYRNWIRGQQQRVQQCRQLLHDREDEVQAALGRVQVARRKVKSLERFRERALNRHLHEALKQEQKALDDLGSVRFALARTDRGGQT